MGSQLGHLQATWRRLLTTLSPINLLGKPRNFERFCHQPPTIAEWIAISDSHRFYPKSRSNDCGMAVRRHIVAFSLVEPLDRPCAPKGFVKACMQA
jgi:hypothetical protein